MSRAKKVLCGHHWVKDCWSKDCTAERCPACGVVRDFVRKE